MRTAVGLVAAFVVAFLLAGNLAILGATAWAREAAPAPAPEVEVPPGVRKFAAVDDKVWRGAAPGERALRALAARGVTTVVDLRAEEDLQVDRELLAELGLRRVHIAIRDGQSPPAELVEAFLDTVAASEGKVFVHCGAGVGRTGTMAASYLVATGQASAGEALQRNLAVGPPSLEQVAFVAELDEGEVDTDRPGAALVAVSRVLDAPRRAWSRWGF